MLVDASLNDLVSDRAESYGFDCEYKLIAQDLSVLIIHADDQTAEFSLLLIEFAQDLAII